MIGGTIILKWRCIQHSGWMDGRCIMAHILTAIEDLAIELVLDAVVQFVVRRENWLGKLPRCYCRAIVLNGPLNSATCSSRKCDRPAVLVNNDYCQ